MVSENAEGQLDLGIPGPGKSTRRITLSIPSDLVDELDRVAKHLGITRSALASGLLSPITSQLVQVIADVDVESPTGDSRRMRGKSVALIGDLLAEVQSVYDDVSREDAAK